MSLKLGEGAFAGVKKATHKETGETCAIKIVNRSSLNKEVEAALQQEIEILKELDHRHIMRLDNGETDWRCTMRFPFLFS